MSKKIKMIFSDFDEVSGISTVIINTPLGEFTGTSRLHEEDRSISSNFAGCQYAEMRAIMAFMKKKIQNLKIEIQSLEKYNKVLLNKKDYNHNSMETRTLRKQLYLKNKEVQLWRNRLQSLHSKMLANMEQREKIIEKMTEKKKEKE